MSDTLEAFKLIDKADLTYEVKFTTQCTVSALHYLRALSSKLGIPIEQITTEQIIDAARIADKPMREHQVWLASRSDRLGGKT
jgi:hypothetical protein